MHTMTKVQPLKRHLRPGRVYRRQDLAQWSNAVDRHLNLLLDDGTLTKLSGGLYFCPKQTSFGDAAAEDEKLAAAFLKDDRFLLVSPNAYNRLGVGTTQLYDKTVVYNHKRHGTFSLGGRTFDLRIKPAFPKALNKEFLLVDLINNLDNLAENQDHVMDQVKRVARAYDTQKLERAARDYGKVRTKKFFSTVLSSEITHGA
jgi:hypothetical protein